MPRIKADSFLYFSFFFLFCDVNGLGWDGDTFHRKVWMEMNPGLDPPSTPPQGVSVLHVRALGANDTLHFLFCSGGAPALLLIHTHSNESTLKVNWTMFEQSDPSGSVRVEPEDSVQYRGAHVFTRLWEYDESNSTGDSVLSPYELQEFEWDDMNKTLDYTRHTAELCGRHTEFSSNASLCLHFSVFESHGREEVWPSLFHTANSSQLSILLKGVMPRTNQSQFGLELQMVSEVGLQSRVDIHRSIDDEYTPSIFQVSEWVWSHENSSSVIAFSQWKPVVYQKSLPSIEDAAPCSQSELRDLPQAPPSRIIHAYFTQNPLTHGLNVTFNITFEPNVNATHFLKWTVLVGIGTPPSDFFSLLVIAIMAVGLGTPFLLLIVGGVYICVRKKKRDTLGRYQSIN